MISKCNSESFFLYSSTNSKGMAAPKTPGIVPKQRKQQSVDQQEMAEIQEVFQFYDTRGDGRVRVDQLGLCLRSLGLCPSQAQLAQLTNQGPEERISMEQFVPMMHSVRKQGGGQDKSETELAAFLDNIDRDGSGSVTVADLRQMLTGFGEPLSEEEFEQILAACGAGRERAMEKEGRLGIGEIVQTLLQRENSDS